jgi:hypothetical protein
MKAVTYRFRFSHGRLETVALTFSADMVVEQRAHAPWASLSAQRCPNCPLEPEGACPFAAALVPFAARFDDVFSYERVQVEVETDLRTIVAERALQHGLASLIGLIGATSGCPRLAFFRPMARFHLPFASEEETLVRAFSFHLLGHALNGGGPDFADLAEHYRGAALVNRAMADRLRSVLTHDAIVNALVVLDTFAQAVPFVIDEQLEEFAPLFVEQS